MLIAAACLAIQASVPLQADLLSITFHGYHHPIQFCSMVHGSAAGVLFFCAIIHGLSASYVFSKTQSGVMSSSSKIMKGVSVATLVLSYCGAPLLCSIMCEGIKKTDEQPSHQLASSFVMQFATIPKDTPVQHINVFGGLQHIAAFSIALYLVSYSLDFYRCVNARVGDMAGHTATRSSADKPHV